MESLEVLWCLVLFDYQSGLFMCLVRRAQLALVLYTRYGDHSKMTDCAVENTCQYVSGHYMVSPNQTGRIPICNAVNGLKGLAPAMGYFPMVAADGGRIHRTMPSLP